MEHKKSKARNGLRGLLYWSLVGVALAVSMFSFHPSHSSAIQQCGTHLLQAIAVGSFAGIDCTGANRPSPSRASPLCSDDEPPVGPPPIDFHQQVESSASGIGLRATDGALGNAINLFPKARSEAC